MPASRISASTNEISTASLVRTSSFMRAKIAGPAPGVNSCKRGCLLCRSIRQRISLRRLPICLFALRGTEPWSLALRPPVESIGSVHLADGIDPGRVGRRGKLDLIETDFVRHRAKRYLAEVLYPDAPCDRSLGNGLGRKKLAW